MLPHDPSVTALNGLAYMPFWCEENIWHLAGDARVGPGERVVLVLTGAEELVACWAQRAAAEGRPLLWDYHVVLLVCDGEWQAWDLDTRLACPVRAESWLECTFPHADAVPGSFQPRFGWFPAETWRDAFGSDREHMRTPDGGWQHPLPPWPMIFGRGLDLPTAVAQARCGLTLDELRRRLAVGRR